MRRGSRRGHGRRTRGDPAVPRVRSRTCVPVRVSRLSLLQGAHPGGSGSGGRGPTTQMSAAARSSPGHRLRMGGGGGGEQGWCGRVCAGRGGADGRRLPTHAPVHAHWAPLPHDARMTLLTCLVLGPDHGGLAPPHQRLAPRLPARASVGGGGGGGGECATPGACCAHPPAGHPPPSLSPSLSTLAQLT